MSTVTHRLSPADGYIDPNMTSKFGPTYVPVSSGAVGPMECWDATS